MKRSPETFWLALGSMTTAALSPRDIDRLRRRVNAEPDGDMLAEALGFVAYDAVERRHHGGYGGIKHSPLTPVRREAMWGEGE